MKTSTFQPQTLLMRPAAANDIPVLTHWDGLPHVIACVTDDPTQNPEDGWDWANELAPRQDGTEFFMACLGNRPIGVVQSIDPHTEVTHYWGDVGPGLRALDIWIGEEDCIGRGYGSQMMTWFLTRCFKTQNAKAVLIDPLASNVRAHRFYERFGFRFLEARIFGDASHCHVMRLTRADWTG